MRSRARVELATPADALELAEHALDGLDPFLVDLVDVQVVGRFVQLQGPDWLLRGLDGPWD